MKKCLICHVELTEANWSSWSAKNYINKCKMCLRLEKNEWLAKKRASLSDSEKASARERSEKGRLKSKKENPKKYTATQMTGSCKKRAKYIFVDCDIDASFVLSIMPDKCPILGVELKYGGGDRSPESASLDRIDSSKGYTRDNVQIISSRANMMKSDATTEEMLKFARWAIKSFDKKQGTDTK